MYPYGVDHRSYTMRGDGYESSTEEKKEYPQWMQVTAWLLAPITLPINLLAIVVLPLYCFPWEESKKDFKWLIRRIIDWFKGPFRW